MVTYVLLKFCTAGMLKDGESIKAQTPLFKRPFGCAGIVL